ncbi:MAG TPA: hypothetical protein VG028_05690 [Terriglobia bacterium]|nr:hypothetical protein [Terriglobia bacterium]
MRTTVILALILITRQAPALAIDGAQSGAALKKTSPAPLGCDTEDKPTTLKAHFDHFTGALISPGTVILPVITSSAGQALTAHAGYSSDWTGFGRHYRDSVIGNVGGKFVEKFALPALFHEDESYCALGPGVDPKERARHVLEHLIWTRSDDHSRRRFAVSKIPGAMMMAAAANAYLPPAQRTASATGKRMLENLGGYLLYDAFLEFRTVGNSNRPMARFCKKWKICD